MRAGDWRDALDYSGAGIRHADISGIVQHFNRSLGFTSAATTWGADQVSAIHFRFANIAFYCQAILSYGILSKGLCSLPRINPLWKTLGLPPTSPSSKQSSLCYHGQEETCHKDRRRVPQGCLWWHFHPDERVESLRRKYDEIIRSNNQAP